MTKPLIALPLVLLLGSVAARAERPSAESAKEWQSEELQGVGQKTADRLACLKYGRHKKEIPDYDPRRCMEDPYPSTNPRDPAEASNAYKGAWKKFLEKLQDQKIGGKPIPYNTSPPDDETEYLQWYHEGNVSGMNGGWGNVTWKNRSLGKVSGMDSRDKTAIDESSHWGEAAVLLLDANKKPVRALVYTFTAYKQEYPTRIDARRWRFYLDRDGKLEFDQHQDGGAYDKKNVAWPPDASPDGPNSIDGQYLIYWHQLLKSWNDQLEKLP